MKSRSEATQGSPNKFGWLVKGMLHRFKSHRGSLRDPANRVAFCASASLAAGQKFDSAQDDVQGFCFAIIRARCPKRYPFVFGRRNASPTGFVCWLVGEAFRLPLLFAVCVCLRTTTGRPHGKATINFPVVLLLFLQYV